jgi:hypothetical protein
MPRQTIIQTIKLPTPYLNLPNPHAPHQLNLKPRTLCRTDNQTTEDRYAGSSILREPYALPTLTEQNE